MCVCERVHKTTHVHAYASVCTVVAVAAAAAAAVEGWAEAGCSGHANEGSGRDSDG